LPLDGDDGFCCLIHAAVHISDDQFLELAGRLLRNRMRCAVVSGVESERLGDLLDELLEDGEYHDNGRMALAEVCDEEPLEEALEYFVLPNGMATNNLLVYIGDEQGFATALETFAEVVDRMEADLVG
jgi:hypothetical protein